jgi:ABC-type dipeptide/oligopeptide/nickel transport system permease subunit
MDRRTREALHEARELLHTNQRSDASFVLANLLKRQPDNAQAWYLLSQAATEKEQQIYALKRVLNIYPDNPKAQARLAQLTSLPAIPSLVEPEPVPIIHKPTPDEEVRQIRARPEVRYDRWNRMRIRLSLSWTRFKDGWKVFSQDRLAMLGLVLIGLFALMSITHPILMRTIWERKLFDPYTGFDINLIPHPAPPDNVHLLGTDALGRDVLSMLLAATTPTFMVGFTAAITTAFLATCLSIPAAFFRGKVDLMLTNLMDVMILLPAPVLMIILGARFRELGPVPLGLIFGTVTGAGSAAIVMRTAALKVSAKPFMEASQIAGGGALHMMTKHFLPNMLPLAALQMMMAVSSAVVADGFVSFFGLQRTSLNWGTLIYDAFLYSNIGGEGTQWHVLIPAAIVFSLFSLSFYLVSRGLHKVADPQLRGDR